MLRSTALAPIALALVGLAACGSDPVPAAAPDAAPADAATPDAAEPDAAEPDAAATPDVAPTPDAAPDVPEPPIMSSSCDLLEAGTVTDFMVDGAPRSFLLTLPTGATAPGGRWPVVFSWHGFGDNAPSFNGAFSGAVNNATMPFILVTPVSTMLTPLTDPPGLDWDQLRVAGPNREARLFDAVLRCVDMRWGVDRDRVYTAGFSAGAILSDLLGVLRGDQLAAVASFSGGYFSNPANPMTLGIARSFIAWPPLPAAHRYPQLLAYGGARDMVSLGVATARFDVFAANDIPYLRAAGHDVVECNHEMAHTVPTAMRAQVIPFFAAHPRGRTPSAWGAALPAGMPSYCAFRAAGM